MRGKEKKKGLSSTNKQHQKDIIYLTIIVATFALFFITFLALNSSEDRCFNHVYTIYNTIESDPCMSQCLNSIPQDTFNYINITIGGQTYGKRNDT